MTSLPGCSKAPPRSLHVLTVDPVRSSFNPWIVQYAADFLVTSSVSSPFIEVNQNERWSLPFCASWKRLDNGKRLTCELAENLRWSDGSSMKATEILDSLKESVQTSRASGIAKLVEQITLEAPNRLTIELNQTGSDALWAFTGLDQVILDPDSREQIRKFGSLQLEKGLKRSSGRFRLNAISSGIVQLEPNPYFPVASSRATYPVEIVGNLSIQEIENRLTKKSPNELAQILEGSVSLADLKLLRKNGLQVFNQLVPNALSAFILGKHALSSMSKSDRRYLYSAIAGKMLETREGLGVPAIGFTPPAMLGALNLDSWRAILKNAPTAPKKPLKIDLFVMKALKSSELYITAKSALVGLPILVNEVIYDPNEPNSPEWKRRTRNDYDLLFGYDESYSSDPDPFWRDMLALSASPRPFFSEADLNGAMLEPDLKKRVLLYQNFEHRCAEDPFIIPLRRFGNELFVAPGVEVAHQEAFGMMINLWAFRPSQ
jgi:hypothetical protein